MFISTLKKTVSVVALLMVASYGYSQKITNEGKEFWVGFGHHQYMEDLSNSENMVLYLSTKSRPATVTVTLDSSGAIPALWYKKVYNIPANSVIKTENLPKGTVNAGPPSSTNPNYDARLYTNPPPAGTGGEGIFRKRGIHITSTDTIVAIAHIYASVSSGATVLLPVQSWGYAYTSINSRQADAGGPGFSWVYVVAKEDNTRIRITPSVTTRLGKPAGVPFIVDLQKGQIYQVVAPSDAGGNGPNFTGTKVESIPGADGVCHAVAAFSGSSRTQGEDQPCNTSSGRDNDMQQMFPEQTWGKRYATVPFSTASGFGSNPTLNASTFMTCVYKIAVTDPTTVVKRNGVALTGLINNTYYRYSSSTPDYIESDKPVMVAQFMSGASNCNPGGLGDPEMVFLVPIEQGVDTCRFFRNDTTAIYANYVSLVVPTSHLGSLKIDNSNTFNYTAAHPNLPGFSIVVKGWAAAKAPGSITCDTTFTGITYGLGSAESYAFVVGCRLENLNAISGVTNNPKVDSTKNHQFTCVETPVKISVLMRYKPLKLVVHVDSLSSSIVTPHITETLNPASGHLLDSIVVNNIMYYRYVLDSTYFFHQAGTYTIPLVATKAATGLCTDDEDLKVTIVVKPKANADFTFTLPSCPTDTVIFTGAPTGASYVNSKWVWEIPVGTPKPDSNQVQYHQFPGPGTYNVKMTALTTEACSADTIKQVVIAPGATTSFTVTPTTLCQGGTVTVTPGSTTATAYYWDFGDATKDTTFTSAPHTHTYTGYGTYIIGHSISNGTACAPSATPQNVTVYANPFATFSFPVGCLDTLGNAQFTSTASAPDGQVISNHKWHFGDPTSGANDSSILSNPSHNYTPGTYTIQYHVSTVNGCFKDTSVTTTFNVSPSVHFNAVPTICGNNAPLDLSTYVFVSNGVPGTGVFTGTGVTSAGIFDPAVAGQGSHLITYIYTATIGGCTDTAFATVNVSGVPVASFTFPTGCLTNYDVAFTNTSSNTAPGYTSTWDFGDLTPTSSATSPTHTYASGSAGPYNVKLTVNSLGCVDDTTISVLVKVLPALNWPALSGVCATLPAYSIANATVTNGVTGTGIYTGTGVINSNGTFDPAVAGVGTHIVKYIFTTAQGCIDSISNSIQVGPGPVPNFTFPTGCLTTSNVPFTDNSAIPAGPTPTFTWDFGQPSSGANNTSNAQNPVHDYTNEGVFNVKLSVAVSGCSRDTTISVTVKIKPQLNFPPLANVCGNVPAYSIATGTVTNGVAGTATYTGAGITNTTTGTFDPAIAGVGSHQIMYTYTTTLGCADSIPRNIVVNAVPKAGFSFPTNCLANFNVQFTDTSINPGAATYAWDFGEPASGASNTSTSSSPSHTYSTSGPFNVKQVVSSNGCSDSTTTSVTVRVQPVLSWTNLTDVCANVPAYLLPAGTVTNGLTGTAKYKGAGITDTLTGMFDPSIAGVGSHVLKFYFTTALGCIDSLSKTINVKTVPTAGFIVPTTCQFSFNTFFQDTSKPNVPTGKNYLWNFGEPSSGAANTSTFRNGFHNYSSSGPFLVKQVVTMNGCSDSVTSSVTVRVRPAISFSALGEVCVNTPPYLLNSATITNAVTGSGIYKGLGITDSITGMYDPSKAGVGTDTVIYVFRTTQGCIDSVKRPLVVKGLPVPAFSYPTGCLNNGLVQFTNNTNPAVGSTYAWDFGDPASGASNTSTATSPSHNYSTFGTYNIKLTATNNGCSKDTTVSATFALKPTLNYPPINGVCEQTEYVNVATAVVTNGVTGTGYYHGLGVDSSGVFTPAVAIAAGVSFVNVTYVFTSTVGGCVDSASSTITVYYRPRASFTFTDSICANTTATIRSTATLPSGTITAWKWNIAGYDTTINNGAPFTYLFPSPGAYMITLEVVSDNNCRSQTSTRTLNVGPIPEADFNAPIGVCMPNGKAQFADASVISDNTALSYLWNFGDGSPLDSTANPSHLYNSSADTAFVKLIVTSAFGCTDDTIKPIAFQKRPYVDFVPDFYVLCQGSANKFYAIANPPAGDTIVNYLWDFGDGGLQSTSQVAPKTFTGYGEYYVKLTATTNNGCTADTMKKVTVNLQPVIDAGPSFSVHIGEMVTFNPVINSPNVSLLWTPSMGLSNATAVRPSIQALANQTYTLTATAPGGCFASDTLTVKILNPITIPNAFSPNGDGINDTWNLENLTDYSNAAVNVYNRYGQPVFSKSGKIKAWDGTHNGKPLPVGTYYYVIELRDGKTAPYTGYVVILK